MWKPLVERGEWVLIVELDVGGRGGGRDVWVLIVELDVGGNEF